MDNIILSEDAGKPIKTKQIKTPNALQKLVNGEYSEAFQKALNGICIYRGCHDKDPVIGHEYVVATPGLRKSQNTTNEYTMLMSDILPAWKEYPKRNRSFICTNSIDRVDDYVRNLEDAFLVLPKNGAKIGVCPEKDLWFSFENGGIFKLNQFNQALNNLGDYVYSNLGKNYDMGTPKGLTKILQSVSLFDAMNEASIYQYMNNLIDKCLNNFFSNDDPSVISMYQCVEKCLDPTLNGFQLMSTSDMSWESYNNEEVWTDSKCLFIQLKTFAHTFLRDNISHQICKFVERDNRSHQICKFIDMIFEEPEYDDEEPEYDEDE